VDFLPGVRVRGWIGVAAKTCLPGSCWIDTRTRYSEKTALAPRENYQKDCAACLQRLFIVITLTLTLTLTPSPPAYRNYKEDQCGDKDEDGNVNDDSGIDDTERH
jgi:hypothetical protein